MKKINKVYNFINKFLGMPYATEDTIEKTKAYKFRNLNLLSDFIRRSILALIVNEVKVTFSDGWYIATVNMYMARDESRVNKIAEDFCEGKDILV